MNEENTTVESEQRDVSQGMVWRVSENETENALKWVRSGKTVAADEIPGEETLV